MTQDTEAMGVELLPCPLCQAAMALDRFVDWEGHPLANQVIIHQSPSDCPLADIQVDATPEAVAAWNRRAAPAVDGLANAAWLQGFEKGQEALSTQVQRLTEENEALKRERDELVYLMGEVDQGNSIQEARIKALEEEKAKLQRRLDLHEAAISFVRRWAVEKEGNGTSAAERLSAIAHHPAIRALSSTESNGK